MARRRDSTARPLLVFMRERNPRDLSEYYKLDEELCTGAEPTEIAIFDDLLTTGSHFKAMKLVLRSMFPGVPISGLFIARRYVVREQGGEGEI